MNRSIARTGALTALRSALTPMALLVLVSGFRGSQDPETVYLNERNLYTLTLLEASATGDCEAKQVPTVEGVALTASKAGIWVPGYMEFLEEDGGSLLGVLYVTNLPFGPQAAELPAAFLPPGFRYRLPLVEVLQSTSRKHFATAIVRSRSDRMMLVVKGSFYRGIWLSRAVERQEVGGEFELRYAITRK